MADMERQANMLIDRIRKLAKGYKGELLLIQKETYSGKGIICLANLTEIVFTFSFTKIGFIIAVQGLEPLPNQKATYIDYSNEAEIQSILNLLEKRIKILDAD